MRVPTIQMTPVSETRAGKWLARRRAAAVAWWGRRTARVWAKAPVATPVPMEASVWTDEAKAAAARIVDEALRVVYARLETARADASKQANGIADRLDAVYKVVVVGAAKVADLRDVHARELVGLTSRVDRLEHEVSKAAAIADPKVVDPLADVAAETVEPVVMELIEEQSRQAKVWNAFHTQHEELRGEVAVLTEALAALTARLQERKVL